MKNWYWLIGACVALLFSYLLNFVEGKESVYHEVNEMFKKESVHWVDSIAEINDQLDISYYDRRKYRAKKLHISITEEDTVIIPCKFFHPQNYEVFSRKTAETAAILDGGEKNGYDFTIVDSLFQRSLRNAGIEAELALELYVKDLAEMFPTEDSEARLAVELHAKGLMNTFSGRDSMSLRCSCVFSIFCTGRFIKCFLYFSSLITGVESGSPSPVVVLVTLFPKL